MFFSYPFLSYIVCSSLLFLLTSLSLLHISFFPFKLNFLVLSCFLHFLLLFLLYFSFCGVYIQRSSGSIFPRREARKNHTSVSICNFAVSSSIKTQNSRKNCHTISLHHYENLPTKMRSLNLKKKRSTISTSYMLFKFLVSLSSKIRGNSVQSLTTISDMKQVI